MSIGLGIFLAAVIVSLTLLYINRRKDIPQPVKGTNPLSLTTMRKGFLIISSFSFVIIAAFLLYSWISNMPKKQDSYEGIKLGASMNEVRYIKGRPINLAKHKVEAEYGYFEPFVDSNKLDKNDSIDNYPRWNFNQITINFDKPNGKVVAISCSAWQDSLRNDSYHNCEPLSGITIDMSEDYVKERLGKPDKEVITSSKEMFFGKYNAKFLLDKQKVYFIEFENPDWVDGSNLTFEKSGFDPSTAKPFDFKSYLKNFEATHSHMTKGK